MNLRKIYSFILVTMPVTNIYCSFVKKVSIADFLMLVFIPYSLIKLISKKDIGSVKNANKIQLQPIILLVGFILITLLSLTTLQTGEYSIQDIMNRLMKYSVYILTVSITGYFLLDFQYAIKHLLNISLIATSYIIIQTLTYYLKGIVLPSILNNYLTPMVQEYQYPDSLLKFYEHFYYRPSSFFMEPADYAQYVLIALTICLFWKNITGNRARYKTALFLSGGLIISTSSTGLYLGAIIWILYYYYYFKNSKNKNKTVTFIGVILIIALLIPIMFNTPIFIRSVDKLFVKSDRTVGSFEFYGQLAGLNRLIGVGFGNEDYYISGGTFTYLNTVVIILVSTGYIGLMSFILLFISLYKNKSDIFRVMIIALFIGCFISTIFFGVYAIIYLTFIYYAGTNQYLLRKNQPRYY